MHEVGADEPHEGERTFDDFVGIMRQAQQHEGDQRDRNLNANRVFGGSQEVGDLQGLFDPSEEQLDGPAPLYKSAISCALATRSLVKMRTILPVSITTFISRTRFAIGFLREAARRCGRYPVRSLRTGDPGSTGRFSTTAKGGLALSRVMMRQPC